MRLLLIHQVFVSKDEAGGTRHFEFFSRLQRQGHECTVVASDLDYYTGQRLVPRRALVTEQWSNGVRILRAYTLSTLHRSFAWRVVSFLSFMLSSVWAGLKAGPVDVVMGTSPSLTQPLSAWLVAVIRRRPFLLEIRDLSPEFAIDLGVLRNPTLIWLARRLEMFLYRHASHLLVNSPAYRDYLISKGVPARRVSLVANGVDPTLFDPAADGRAVRDEFGMEGKYTVTYAGALGLCNDIETILHAADILRDQRQIHFLLVGDGKERPNLERLARELRLENVTFTGSRPKSQMPQFLAASDVCVATLKNIPMFTTTYPNKVFDYMAAGRPIVLGIDGVIRQVVEAAEGGIFSPPGDPQSLAAAVQRLHDDRPLARQMGQRARQYVERHFHRHRQAEQFEKLVLRLADGQCNAPVDSQQADSQKDVELTAESTPSGSRGMLQPPAMPTASGTSAMSSASKPSSTSSPSQPVVC